MAKKTIILTKEDLREIVTTATNQVLNEMAVERGYNAALNILDEGLRIIGSSTTEFTLVDYPTTERWQRRNVLTVDDRLSNGVLKKQW